MGGDAIAAQRCPLEGWAFQRRTGQGPALERTEAMTTTMNRMHQSLPYSRSMRALLRREAGVIVGMDEERAAQLGEMAGLPSLAESLAAWVDRISRDLPEDYAVPMGRVLLAPNGEYMPFAARTNTEEAHGRPAGYFHSSPNITLPATYRVFGNVLREHCTVARNVARNLILLPTWFTGPGHRALTMRMPAPSGGLYDSPRAAAYNAFLDTAKAGDEERMRSVRSISGEEQAPTTIVFRTRLLPAHAPTEEIPEPEMKRTVIGAVSPTHCLKDGDDDKLIAALSLAFAGYAGSARASAYRGVEESELRAIFPSLKVHVEEMGDTTWSGYIVARNSESGAKSWSIAAGLYREDDGMSVACEALVKTGRHVGKKVAERMVDVAEAAAELLQKLIAEAAELAGRVAPWSEAETMKKLGAALAGTVAGGDVACATAFEIGRQIETLKDPITIGLLVNALGRVASNTPARGGVRPLEVMLGRMLVKGWDELKAVQADSLDDGSEEE